jgi:hypothetical protein
MHSNHVADHHQIRLQLDNLDATCWKGLNRLFSFNTFDHGLLIIRTYVFQFIRKGNGNFHSSTYVRTFVCAYAYVRTYDA